MDKYEKAIEKLCVLLDLDIYIPVKKELEGCGRTYSLGIRKENFKGDLERIINSLRGDHDQT